MVAMDVELGSRKNEECAALTTERRAAAETSDISSSLIRALVWLLLVLVACISLIVGLDTDDVATIVTKPAEFGPSHQTFSPSSPLPSPTLPAPSPPSKRLPRSDLPPPPPQIPMPVRPIPIAPPPALPPPPLPLCFENLHATGVSPRNEGEFGTTDPVLWVYEGKGNIDTVQKTEEKMNTLEPTWDETICISLGSLADPRVCFDIRDDFDPAFPVDEPPLLHFGCMRSEVLEELHNSSAWARTEVHVELTHGATLWFELQPTVPAPPPAPPRLPFPPLPPPLPPHPPPPPSTPFVSVVDKLNKRFAEGKYTNNLAEAGVMLHQFDGLDDPNPNGEPWRPGAGRWDVSDRISASLVYASMARDKAGNLPLYSFDLGGIILSSEFNRLLCSHPGDVGSLARKCAVLGGEGECVPGCSVQGESPWCLAEWNFYCAFAPSRLADAMQTRDELSKRGEFYHHKMWNDGKFYDEHIFDAFTFTSNLPKSIVAFFFIRGNCGDAYDGPKCESYVRLAHANFLRHFGLTRDDVPLVRLDLFKKGNHPFIATDENGYDIAIPPKTIMG